MQTDPNALVETLASSLSIIFRTRQELMAFLQINVCFSDFS